MIAPAYALAVIVTAFRVVGAGHPATTEIDHGSCPQGRWTQALAEVRTPRRIGTMRGCGLSISKGVAGRLDPAWIHMTASEQFVLPGGILTATCDERFRWTDDHHSRATFRCRVDGGGRITGGGRAVDGRADYLLRIRP
jgi:hypothetical protein